MKRFAIVVSLFSGACLAAIEGSPPAEDEPQQEPMPLPPAEVVEITVRNPAGPVAGLAVVFMNADDSVVADVVTDAQGLASATLPNGGSVTVVQPGAASPPSTMPDDNTPQAEATPAQVYTYVDVKPGDKLQLVTQARASGASITARVKVPMTADMTGDQTMDPAGDQNGELKVITVITPCGSGVGIAPYIDVTLEGCGAETDFYVVDLSSNLSFLKRAAIATTVDLSTETLRDSLSTTLSVTNAPSGASVAIESRLETDLFRPVYSSGLLPFTTGDATDANMEAATTATANVPSLPTTEQHLSAAITTAEGSQLVTHRAPHGQTGSSIDVGAHLIKTPSAATLSADTMTWTEQGTGTPDLVFASIAGATTVRTIVAPYASASLRVPRLPAAHDAYNIQTTDSAAISLAKVGGGYDGARARVFAGPLAPMGGYATITVTAGDRTDVPTDEQDKP